MKTQLGDQNAVSETRPPSAPPQAATEEAVAPEPLVLLVRSAEADDAVLDAPPPAADSAAGPPEPGPVIAFIQQGSLTDMTAISSLVDPEQAVVVTAGEDDTLSSLLSSVPADRGSMSSEERVAVFQADDGQLVCLTYTVAPVAGEDGCDTDVVAEVDLDSADTVGSETTVSEPAGVFQEHFILSGLSSSPVAVVPNSLNLQIFPDITNEAGDGKMTPEQVLAKLRVEDRLRVLEQLLPPAPPLARAPRAPPAAPASDAPRPKSLPPLRPRPPAAAAAPPAPPAAAAADAAADADAAPYACDLCGARFQRPEQFYGHLHRHRGERRFRCALCPAAAPDFPTAAQLRAHERRQHPGARPHACARCPATFERASQLGYHARRVHEGERPHSCAVCPKSFFKRSDLHTHLHVHLGIHKSVCETCGRGFGHVSNLIRHARTHSGVRPYPCPDCGRRFGQLNAMLQHRASHDAARREPCPACGRLFKSAAVMRKHARAAHGACPPAAPPGAPAAPRARRFHCAACGDAFAFSALLRQHERQHEAGAAALPCGGCGRACASVEELKTHACAPPARARAPPPHAPAPSPPPLPPPDSAPPAPAPHDLGDSQRLLESLLLGAAEEEEEQQQEAQAEQEGGVVVLVAGGDADAQAGDADGAAAVPLLVLRPRTAPPPLPAAPLAPLLPAPPPPPPPPPSPAPAPPAASSADAAAPPRRRAAAFTCSECGKVFLKSGNYKQHLGMHFVDQKKHGCPTCGQLFAWKSTLNKHVARAHARGEAAPRPRCELCGRDYATAAQVQEHVRRDHFLQRPHACPAPACKKRFYKKHDLKVHLRMHNKERPYICGSCGKTFNHLSHIIRHERIHSGLRPYTCSDCGRQFNQSSALKSHRQRHRDKEQQQQIQLRQQQQLCQQQDLEADEEQGAGGVTSLAPSPLDVPELQAADLEPVELDAPSLEVPEDAVSLLPSHGLEVSPPEPLVELTVSDAEMVLGLPTSIIFAQGLFPDVT